MTELLSMCEIADVASSFEGAGNDDIDIIISLDVVANDTEYEELGSVDNEIFEEAIVGSNEAELLIDSGCIFLV